MATDYALKLRATLDTAEVQQKLQQLQSQMQQFKENTIGSSKNAINANNVRDGNIQGALKSLQTSVERLNQSINKINQMQMRSASFQNRSTVAPTGAFPFAISPQTTASRPSFTSARNDIQYFFDDLTQLSKDLDGIDTGAKALAPILRDLKRSTSIFSTRGMRRRAINRANAEIRDLNDAGLQVADRIIGDDNYTPFHLAEADAIRNARLRRLNQKYGLRPANMSNMQRNLLNAGRAFAGSQALGMVSDQLTAYGHTTAGGVVSGLSEGINAGAMTAAALSKFAIGGPAGLLVGFGVATNSIINALIESAQKIAKASEEAYAILQSGKKRIAQHQENVALMRWNDQTLASTPEQRKVQLDAIKKQVEAAKQEYYSLSDNSNPATIYAARRYLEESNNTEAGSEERIAIERKYGEAVVAYADSIDKAKKQLDELTDKQHILETLVNEDIRKSEHDKAEKERESEYDIAQKELERTAAERKRLLEAEQKRLEAEQSLNIKNASIDIITGLNRQSEQNSVTQQLFDIQYDKKGFERRTSASSKFQQASELLDDYRAQRQNALNLARIQAQNASDTSFSNEYRQHFLEMSAGNIENAQHLAGIISQIEGFIYNLDQNGIKPPNMQNVTSLSQYGFSMGERNDNVSRMEKYYQNVEDLTRQIRNKLQEGIKTDASYN